MIKTKLLSMYWGAAFAAMLASVPAAAAPALAKDSPIEISSDKLDVFQNEHKAIFTGNVIAVQGTSTMRSAEMTVFYRDSDAKAAGAAAPKPAPAPVADGAKPAAPQGIYRIEADGKVVFTTPTEIALGDKGIYDVDADTIDVLGSTVTLTRGANILKGTKLHYNMATGRSILTGGAADAGNNVAGKPARVHGLFMPKSDNKPASKP